jgi:hypothetical protein
MIKAAYLRVYVPGEAGDGDDVAETDVIREVDDYGLVSESLDEGVLATTWNETRYVCPRHPRLRLLEGLLGFRNAYPGLTAELLIPEEIAERAGAELEALRDRNPEARSHILTSPWHVPLRWFSAFEPQERLMRSSEEGSTVLYRTTVAQADARLARALVILQEAGFQEAVIDQVQELYNWVTGFDGNDLLELDYGKVAKLFTEGALALDETAGDIQSSLNALEAGNLDEASDHYATAAARWAHAQSLTYMN